MSKFIHSFSEFNTENLLFPVLISVPHAGREYPQSLLNALRVPSHHLYRLEDRAVDMLATKAFSIGHSGILAHRPRAWIDLNRAENEIDIGIIDGLESQDVPSASAKVRGGLGLIPSRLSGVGDLWKKPFNLSDLKSRIEEDHQPYHQRVSEVLQNMRNKFGGAILLDLHSMPSLTQIGADRPAQLVVGDRYGSSAGSRYSERAIGIAEQYGIRCGLNHPYAGGYILNRHACPDRNIHAIQLEFDRALYLDDSQKDIGGHAATMSQLLLDTVTGLSELIIQSGVYPQFLSAAE